MGNPESNPADDRYELDLCITEIKNLNATITSLKSRLSTLERDLAKAQERVKTLEGVLGKANYELAALTPHPAKAAYDNTLWPIKTSEADRECLRSAFEAIREYLDAVGQQEQTNKAKKWMPEAR